jgi:hypothetical protein
MWSIGIYTGDFPFDLSSPDSITNPVLTARDVVDVNADFVADPFMVHEGGTWYMFFEVMNGATKKGEIGLATSCDGFAWTYKQIVLSEPFHLSYPYLFEWENEYYMIPEAGTSMSVRLYKAFEFPTKWVLSDILLDGAPFLDTSVIYHNNTWWMFTALPDNGTLLLHLADCLTGTWEKHPGSPLISGDRQRARPGGRPIVLDGKVFRFAQDDLQTYGNKVRVFEITEISRTAYHEQEMSKNPIIAATGSGWNGLGMHTIDLHKTVDDKWNACVDGIGWQSLWR